MSKPLPIDAIYKRAESLVDDLRREYRMTKEDADLLKAEMNALLVSVHNSVAAEMRDNAVLEITKTLERIGYRK